MYGLTEQDLSLQATARAFADELIPLEVEAELNAGDLGEGIAEKHKQRAGLPRPARRPTSPPTPADKAAQLSSRCSSRSRAAGSRTRSPGCWAPRRSGGSTSPRPTQRERWLDPTIRGETEECYAITEEHAGSDVSELEATVRRDGDDYVLDGVKWHVTSFFQASYCFFQGVLTEGEHAGEHALVVVDLPSPGVRVVRTPAYSHTTTHQHPIVAFEGVRVPVSHLVGQEGEGMTFAHEWFRFERLMVAARCLGAAERLVDEMTAFAAERKVGGAPLASKQLVQAMLADSLTELYAARSLVYETARGIDEGLDRKVLHARASMAKLYASEMAGRVADRAVQVFGGRGYMRENVAERFTRELRVERIWEGSVGDPADHRGRPAAQARPRRPGLNRWG